MMLEVSGIRFAYNSHPVLSEVSFCLEKGRVLGILGVNGAGKSTLLKCMNRVLRPQAGAVYLNGETLADLTRRQIARRMGYVPQRHTAAPLSVYETVLLGRKPRMGWTMGARDHGIVASILSKMGLRDLALRPVTDLSGGEAQKVMIARALAQEPEVLLLDEPTSNLDLKNQLEVMGLIRGIVKEQSICAVVSIHDLNLALRFADSFVFLKNHRVHTLVEKDRLGEETIREVYDVKVRLHEVDGRTVVVPL